MKPSNITMKRINLLPKTAQRALQLRFFADQLLFFWAWFIISLVFFLGLTYTAKIYLSSQVTNLDSQIDSNKLILKSSDNELLKQQVEGLDNQIKTIKSLQSQHYYWSETLIELAKLLPSDISVESVTLKRATNQIRIEGIADNRESVLKFWADVHKSDYFVSIDFPLANLNKATDDPFTFTLVVNKDRIKSP